MKDNRSAKAGPRFQATLPFWAAAVLLPFVVAWTIAVLRYAASPCYADHLESAIVINCQQWIHGRPLYHDPTSSPYLYSILYGPACFLSTGFWLGLFPDPIVASKVSGAFWAFLSPALLFYACARRFGMVPALAATGALASVFYHFPSFLQFLPTFWDRPDPILVASTTFGLLALVIENRRVGISILGIALGLAISAKIHGFLYLLPAGAVWFRRHGFRSLVAVLIIGGVVAVAPFFLPGVSLQSYLAWLRLATAHGLVKSLLADNLMALAVLLVPLAFLPWAIDSEKRVRWFDEENLLFLSLMGAGILVCVPASKAGGGAHHLLPLAPYVAYLVANALATQTRRQWNALSVCIGLLWLICAYPRMVYFPRPILDYSATTPPAEVISDLRGILSRYDPREIQMGCSGESQYPLTFYAPLVYQSGAPRVAEVSSCMDMKASGLSLRPLEESLRKKEFKIWLIPRGGSPFSMINLYDEKPLFEDSVARTFLQNYAIVESTHFYDVYQALGKPF